VPRDGGIAGCVRQRLYPSRADHDLLVPFTAGGPTDALGLRNLEAERDGGASLGQPADRGKQMDRARPGTIRGRGRCQRRSGPLTANTVQRSGHWANTPRIKGGACIAAVDLLKGLGCRFRFVADQLIRCCS